jgi:hypothetical protein
LTGALKGVCSDSRWHIHRSTPPFPPAGPS